MRIRLVAALLTCFIPSLAIATTCSNTSLGGGWTCVQAAQNFRATDNGTHTISATLGAGMGTGSLILVHIESCPDSSCAGDSGVPSAADTSNTPYICSSSASVIGPSPSLRISTCYFCGTVSGPTVVTATLGGLALWQAVIGVEEFTNSNGNCSGNPLDQIFAQRLTSASPYLVSTPGPTTQANELIYSSGITVGAMGVGGSFTFVNTITCGNTCGDEAKNGATATTYTTNWTGSTAFLGTILTFTAPSASGALTPRPWIINMSFNGQRGIMHRKNPWDNRKRKLEIVRI